VTSKQAGNTVIDYNGNTLYITYTWGLYHDTYYGRNLRFP